MLPRLTVVISPLISLMKDQVDALDGARRPGDVRQQHAHGERRSRDRLARVMRGDVKLLYVAPERFDFGTTAERLRDVGVSLLAVDEAHCISEWGHDFRPSYLRIAQVREKLGWPPAVALTATATPHVRERHRRGSSGSTSAETIITGFDRTNLHYHVRADAQRRGQGRRARSTSCARTRGSPSSTRPRDATVETDRAHRSSDARIHGGGVSRRARRRASPRGAGRVHERGRARHRGDERLRHGHRQAQRARRHPPRHAGHARGVLPGGGTRRPRRPALRRASSSTRSPIASRTSSSSRARYPERATVEQVYAKVVKMARPHGERGSRRRAPLPRRCPAR